MKNSGRCILQFKEHLSSKCIVYNFTFFVDVNVHLLQTNLFTDRANSAVQMVHCNELYKFCCWQR